MKSKHGLVVCLAMMYMYVNMLLRTVIIRRQLQGPTVSFLANSSLKVMVAVKREEGAQFHPAREDIEIRIVQVSARNIGIIDIMKVRVWETSAIRTEGVQLVFGRCALSR